MQNLDDIKLIITYVLEPSSTLQISTHSHINNSSINDQIY